MESDQNAAPNLEKPIETPNTFETPFIGMLNHETNTWISNDYCSDWKLHEAIREILQNQMDGMCIKSKGGKKFIEINPSENELDFEFIHSQTKEKLGAIKYDKENKVLTIWNIGTLETADLLLGGVKGASENQEIIGRFGEGMKLAALAFNRLGKIFMIITGGEEWKFEIRVDDNFKRKGESQKCLFWWKIKNKNKEYKDKIIVIMRNIELEEWQKEIDNYLWLTQKNTGAVTCYANNKTVLGQILLGEEFRNKIYVKDIFVINTMKKEEKEKNIKNTITHCFFGFNTNLKLDRDRNCVPDLNERNQKTSQIIAFILNNRLTLYNQTSSEIHQFLDNFPKEILQLLGKNYGVTYYLHSYINKEGANLLWHEWKKNPDYNGRQPCDNATEKNIKNFILNKKLNDDFYPYVTNVSWQQWNCLRKSVEYMSIEQKFDSLKKNSQPDSLPEKFAPAIKDICEKMKKVLPNFDIKNIQFKKYITPVDKDFSYIEKDIIYFSSDLFNGEPDLKWKIKILAKCFQIKGISAQKIIEVFSLIK